MRRNQELLNKLILTIEELKKPIPSENIDIGFPKNDVVYHVSLLRDAGFIVSDQPIRGPETNLEFMHVFRLTNAGHDIADKIRSGS